MCECMDLLLFAVENGCESMVFRIWHVRMNGFAAENKCESKFSAFGMCESMVLPHVASALHGFG